MYAYMRLFLVFYTVFLHIMRICVKLMPFKEECLSFDKARLFFRKGIVFLSRR